MLIDRITLELILATGEAGTISAAARRLHLSPSLATRKIAAVEQMLGARLFIRTTKNSFTTEAGQRVINWARIVLRDEAMMRDELNGIRGELSGVIRFACPEFMLVTWVTGWLADFAERHPKVSLSLLAIDRPVQLAEERYDVALHIGDQPAPSLIGRRLHDVVTSLYATSAYLDRYGRLERPGDLTRHRLIRHASLDEQTWTLRASDGTSEEVPLDCGIECSNAVLALDMMMQDAGILRASPRTMQTPRFAEQVERVLPGFEPTLRNGDRWGVWMLFPDKAPKPRVRTFADELAAQLARRLPHSQGF